MDVRLKGGGLHNEGRDATLAAGIKFGRKRTVDRQQLLRMHEDGVGATEIARELKIGRATVYKILKEEHAVHQYTG